MMKLTERFQRLTLWNKLAMVGALASILGVVLTIAFYVFPNRQNDERLIEAWDGTWEHSSPGANGIVTGTMRLFVENNKQVRGSFTSNAPSDGIIEGKAVLNGARIEGKWKNQYDQSGKFVFDLGADKTSFKGYYSMVEQKPGKNPSNFWNGIKVTK